MTVVLQLLYIDWWTLLRYANCRFSNVQHCTLIEINTRCAERAGSRARQSMPDTQRGCFP